LPAARLDALAWTVAAALLVVAALATRLLWLGEKELFRDEAASWLESRYPLQDLFRVASTEPYPPLYALVLKGWMAFAGDGEAALRALSVLASLVVVLAAWRWAHEALGRWPGLVVVLVLSLSPVAISNARTARMYSLETAFATVAWWMAWRLITGRAADRRALVIHALVLAIAGAGEVWTIALGPPMLALQLLVALVAVVASRRSAPAERSGSRWAAGALIVGALSLAPWVPSLVAMAASARAYWTPPPEALSWALTWRTMLTGWRGDVRFSIELGVLLLLVAAAGLAWLLTRSNISLRRLGWCVAAGLGLTVGVWAVSLFRSVYDTRYLEASLPPLAIAIAAGGLAFTRIVASISTRSSVARRRVTPVRASAAAAVLSGAVLLFAMVPVIITWLDDWRFTTGPSPTRDVIAAIASRMHPGDVVVAVDARSYFTLAYEAEMRRRSGEPLAGPLLSWDSGTQPFYWAQSLISATDTVPAKKLASAGWRAAFTDLAPDGSIWLVALANGRNERIGFAPLETGRAREVDRLVLESHNGVAQIRQLEVVR
jgi:dolichyl-phosphate-mannose-protein mannosyltransferase